MRIRTLATSAILLVLTIAWHPAARAAQGSAKGFTVEQVLGFPSPDTLVASSTGSTIAWTFNDRGVRSIFVADGPTFAARQLVAYPQDDGQELTQLAFSKDGKTIVYVRGGDHGGRAAEAPPNPAQSPVQPRIQIWSIAVAGGNPRLVADGDSPAIAPDSARVAFVRDRKIFIAPIDGSRPAEQAFYARGTSDSPTWSPDGKTLAFVLDRTEHSFIGLFTPGQPIRYIAPSTSRDSQPAWSGNGTRLAFLRQPGIGGTPRSPLAQPPSPWQILVADVATKDDITAAVVADSGEKPVDRILQSPSGIGLRWAGPTGDILLFMSYRDGFPHVHSIERPAPGKLVRLLTPGPFMVEHVAISPDGSFLVYSANTGTTSDDIDRRHLFRVAISGDTPPSALTSGTGIEWNPVITGDNQSVAYIGATAQRPPLPTVVPATGGAPRQLAAEKLPLDYPSTLLVTPELVSFKAADGVEAHGQLFKPIGGAARKPAIVYIHGGGPRQMMLGFHNRWEYANDYAANQYLVSRGFIVLSVDYRLSVGYGEAFQFAENTGPRGASEYRDILAAGRYLQNRSDVDRRRIGIWGASLGGYLTALGLGRNSDVFASGVDIHGVHDRLPAINPTQLAHALVGDGITEADLREALRVQFESSPIASVKTWKSPVLLIHGDDDRLVDFRQSIDLKKRLEEKGVHVEELVLPDDVHDSLLWKNWVTSVKAMSKFFEKTLRPESAQ